MSAAIEQESRGSPREARNQELQNRILAKGMDPKSLLDCYQFFQEEIKRPIYHIAEMKKHPPDHNPPMIMQTVAGEFMKAGIVTKPSSEGPPLHMHPNEEQFTPVLEGRLHMILGDEDRIVERGDLIHIPCFTPHRSGSVDPTAVFFTVKDPVGDGDLNQD